MEEDIKTVGEELDAALTNKTRQVASLLLFIKIALVVAALGVAVGGVSLLDGKPLDPWKVSGVALALLIAFGNLSLLFLDSDVTKEMIIARKATQAARRALAAMADWYRFQDSSNRYDYLYRALVVLIRLVRQTPTGALSDHAGLVESMFVAAERNLRAACSFKEEDEWSICIYKTADGTNGPILKHLASRRSIPCDPSKARSWPIGIGVAGAALANKREVIVPDMSSPALGTTFVLPGLQARPHDEERYRSFVAVPIISESDDDKIWGMVVATNDRPGHFAMTDSGLPNAEPIRALAAIIAMAVSP